MEKKIVTLDVSNLWTPYISNTLGTCVNKYALQTITDPDIHNIYDKALHLSKNFVQKITGIFQNENFPIPYGFTDEDVHLNAPRLFSDDFWLFYVHEMTIHGLIAYSLGITTSRRLDVRQFYSEAFKEATELFDTTLGMMQSKGLLERPPQSRFRKKLNLQKNKAL